MRVVMRRTGLSADVLRAWERRYHAVHPVRSQGGQRRYSDDDVDRLALLRRVTALGRTISQVAALRTDQLRTLLMEDETALEVPQPADADRAADDVRTEAMGLVRALDGPELDQVLRRAALRLGVGPLVERVILPLRKEIDDQRHQGDLNPAHEHLAGSAVERVLHWIRESSSPVDGAPGIVLATTEGEQDELEIQVMAAVAAVEGWRVIYLGGDLRADSIIQSTRQAGAQVLALSFGSDDGAREFEKPVHALREGLPAGTAVIVGSGSTATGESALTAQGVTVLPSLDEVRAFLKTFR